MNTIWKYPFKIIDRFVLQMPEFAEILHVDMQNGLPCLWAMVNTERPQVPRAFTVIGTGNQIVSLANLRHVGTFYDDPFVWHLFEVTR